MRILVDQMRKRRCLTAEVPEEDGAGKAQAYGLLARRSMHMLAG